MSAYAREDFHADYPDDGVCLRAIMRMQRGGRDVYCPACMVKARFHLMTKRRGFACQECGHHIFPCVGTVFAKSSTPLTKWFLAIYLMAGDSRITAKDLQRQLGVTYKTAWRMRDELKKVMASADYRGALAGERDNDEL